MGVRDHEAVAGIVLAQADIPASRMPPMNEMASSDTTRGSRWNARSPMTLPGNPDPHAEQTQIDADRARSSAAINRTGGRIYLFDRGGSQTWNSMKELPTRHQTVKPGRNKRYQPDVPHTCESLSRSVPSTQGDNDSLGANLWKTTLKNGRFATPVGAFQRLSSVPLCHRRAARDRLNLLCSSAAAEASL